MSEDLVNRPFNFYDALGKSDLAEYAHALKTLWLVSFELPEIMMGTTIGGIRTSPNISGAYSRINTKEGNLMNTQNAGNAFGGYAWEGIDDYNTTMAATHQSIWNEHGFAIRPGNEEHQQAFSRCRRPGSRQLAGAPRNRSCLDGGKRCRKIDADEMPVWHVSR